MSPTLIDAARAASVARAQPIEPRQPATPPGARVREAPRRDRPDERGPGHLRSAPRWHRDDGSLVAEYGLLMVLGATITMLATKWATGGAIWSLFGSVLSRARALVGA